MLLVTSAVFTNMKGGLGREPSVQVPERARDGKPTVSYDSYPLLSSPKSILSRFASGHWLGAI